MQDEKQLEDSNIFVSPPPWARTIIGGIPNLFTKLLKCPFLKFMLVSFLNFFFFKLPCTELLLWHIS